MEVEIFVISLARDAQRRQRISRQLQELGLPFVLQEAVDADAITVQELAQANARRAGVFPAKEKLKKGELACALSHNSVYRAVLDKGLDGAVVLEDDVILQPGFADFVRWLRERPDGSHWARGMIYLGGNDGLDRQELIVTSLWGKESLPAGRQLHKTVRSAKYLGRACACFVGSMAARRLLDFNSPPLTVADDWDGFCRQHVIRRWYMVSPFVVSHPVDFAQGRMEAERMCDHRPARKWFHGVRLQVVRPLRLALVRCLRQACRLLP